LVFFLVFLKTVVYYKHNGDVDIAIFFEGLKVADDEKKQSLSILKSECVTFAQLKSDITDEDLQELNFSRQMRAAILEQARVLGTATVSPPHRGIILCMPSFTSVH
jgi:hypothetical protein